MIAYRNGDLPMLPAEHQLDSNSRNAGYELESPFEDPIERWLSSPGSPDRFTSDQTLTLSGCRSEGQIKRQDQMELANLLTNLGWSKPKNKETIDSVRGRFWQKLPDHPPEPLGRSEVGAQVGQSQTPDPDSLPPSTDQPDQPINKEEKKGGIEGGTAGSREMFETGWSVGHLPPPPPDDPLADLPF